MVTAAALLAILALQAQPATSPAPGDCTYDPAATTLTGTPGLIFSTETWETNPALPLGEKLYRGEVVGASFQALVHACERYGAAFEFRQAEGSLISLVGAMDFLHAQLTPTPKPTPLKPGDIARLSTEGEIELTEDSIRRLIRFSREPDGAVLRVLYSFDH